MMYPFLTMDDDTEITHSEMRKALLCNNNAKIPAQILRNLLRMIDTIIQKWFAHFGQISYYC